MIDTVEETCSYYQMIAITYSTRINNIQYGIKLKKLFKKKTFLRNKILTAKKDTKIV